MALPYIDLPALHLGPVPIHPFGVCVGLGILLGRWLTLRQAPLEARDGLDGRLLWTLAAGFLSAHLVEVALYRPTWADLWRIWDGLSSFGGFIGGGAAYLALTPRGRRLVESEWALRGLVLGWIFGRLGCAVVHDHPGLRSDHPLAVAFPGGARHDLGLYELIFTLLLFAIISLPGIWRLQRARPGALTALVVLLYAPTRLLLDTLRAEDHRYAGLTPAQYGCLALIPLGFTLLWRALHSRYT